MTHKFAQSFFPLALGVALLPLTSQAQLKITEVEASEKGIKADWWELTNLGGSAVDITGYKMDDDSASFSKSVALSGVSSIGAGQSAVFFEVTGTTPLTVQGFRDWWGLDASTLVGTYSGSGVGLGAGVGGDQVNIFNSSGTLIDSVVFGQSTAGTTFGWNPATGTFGAASVAGVNGAFIAPQDGDIGSPGSVPEPSVWGLFGLAIGGLLLRVKQKRG